MDRTTVARNLRQTSGLAEQKVWTLVRSGKIDGHKFRRQHPVGHYIVDFACERLRLVIEIDGGIHKLDEVAQRDLERQAIIEHLGWTVLRFSNEQALGQPDLITSSIRVHARLIRPSPAHAD